MESIFQNVTQWVDNLEDCPEFAIFEHEISTSDVNCLGYSLGAAKGVQPGEIAFRRALKQSTDPVLIKDSFNVHLSVRSSMNRDAFEEDIRESITLDGLQRVKGPEDLLKEGHYPVILFFTQKPGSRSHADFHFIRLNSSGDWSWVPGIGEPISRKAIDFSTLEEANVTNPLAIKWPPGHTMDSVWLVPKGGYETLLMGPEIQLLGKSRERSIGLEA